LGASVFEFVLSHPWRKDKDAPRMGHGGFALSKIRERRATAGPSTPYASLRLLRMTSSINIMESAMNGRVNFQPELAARVVPFGMTRLWSA
jgi:hypothetical protein